MNTYINFVRIHRLQGEEGGSNKSELNMAKYFMDGLSPCLTVVYHQNHYFGLGLIPKPKPKLPILSVDTVTDTETTFQRENLVTDSMGHFFHHKRALKIKICCQI